MDDQTLDIDTKAEALPFSEKKQGAVLGHFLINARFYQQARHRLRPGWFLDPNAGKVVLAKNKFYDEMKRIPSTEELTEWGDFATEEPKVREAMRRTVQKSIAETANFGLDAVSQELQNWYQAVIFKDAASEAARLFNNRKFEQCYLLLDKKMDEIRTARFVDDHEYEWDNFSQDIEQEMADRANACTLGMPLMDRALLPDGPAGSLLPGDQTIILGSTNTGKTRVMTSIVRHNLVSRRSILWIVHEGRDNDIAMLLRCSLLGVTRGELFEMMHTAEGRARIAKATMLIKKYVTFVPYMKAGMTVEDIEPIIRNKCEERAARNNGKTFDLFVSDYPAKLTTKLAQGGHMPPRLILDYVYNYHVNLAGEYRYHSLVGYQTNRAGAQAQSGHGNKDTSASPRLLVMEDAAEAYGPMQTATNVITLNRPPELKARGLLTFNFCKSRSGETGIAVCAKADYGRVMTHSKDAGAISYRGSSTMIDQLDTYMGQYLNGAVPEELTLGG